MTLIECEDLVVTLEGTTILAGANMIVEPGEIVGVVGKSGEGKTTLLKALLGLIPLTSGRVLLMGQDFWASSGDRQDWLRRHFGMVFQGGALFDSMSVAENVGFFPSRVQRKCRREVAQIVSEKLALVGLAGTEDLRPAALSGGMAKRVAIARALAMEPDALLFDEPTAQLDPITCAQLEYLVVELRDRVGVAAVVVSHDFRSLGRMADRMVLLEGGEAVLSLAAEEFQRSEDPRVRALVSAGREVGRPDG